MAILKTCRSCGARFRTSGYSPLDWCNLCAAEYYESANKIGKWYKVMKNKVDRKSKAQKKIAKWYRSHKLRQYVNKRILEKKYNDKQYEEKVDELRKKMNKWQFRRFNLDELDQCKWDEYLLYNGEKKFSDADKLLYQRLINIRKQNVFKNLYGNKADEIRNKRYEKNVREDMRRQRILEEEGVSFADIEDYKSDPMVINSDIKFVILNGSKKPLDIYKFKGKNSEVRGKWVLYWNKEDNAVGIKYVEKTGKKKWFPKRGNKVQNKPDFRKRNIFYLDIISDKQKLNFPCKVGINYTREGINRTIERTFTVDQLNDEERENANFVEINWNSPSGKYTAEFENFYV